MQVKADVFEIWIKVAGLQKTRHFTASCRKQCLHFSCTEHQRAERDVPSRERKRKNKFSSLKSVAEPLD